MGLTLGISHPVAVTLRARWWLWRRWSDPVVAGELAVRVANNKYLINFVTATMLVRAAIGMHINHQHVTPPITFATRNSACICSDKARSRLWRRHQHVRCIAQA